MSVLQKSAQSAFEVVFANGRRSILTEVDGGNLDARTSMGAAVRIMQDEAGSRYVLKFATRPAEREQLALQLQHLKRMQAIHAPVPAVEAAQLTGDVFYYAMPFVSAMRGEDWFFPQTLRRPLFQHRFRNLLETVETELWAKGDAFTESRHFTMKHLCSALRGLTGCDECEHPTLLPLRNATVMELNGSSVPTLRVLLDKIVRNASFFDAEMASMKIPGETHGDIHFGNMLMTTAGRPYLIDPDGRPHRQQSIIEYELSRLLLGFPRQILIEDHCRIEARGAQQFTLALSPRARRILALRNIARTEIASNPRITPWFEDCARSLRMIELLEALHFVSVFHLRKLEKQRVVVYFFGTQLLARALAAYGLEA